MWLHLGFDDRINMDRQMNIFDCKILFQKIENKEQVFYKNRESNLLLLLAFILIHPMLKAWWHNGAATIPFKTNMNIGK